MKPDCNCDYDTLDLDEFVNFTGKPKRKAVYSITLAELIDAGVFDWSKDYLNWQAAAYDDEQYERVCNYFVDRFYYREISMLPFKIWANFLLRKIKYELMPKYRFLYSEAAKNVSMQFGGSENSTLNWTETGNGNLSKTTNESSDDYYKKRDIHSDYPETLLSSNSDYLSSGNDTEDERVTERNTTDTQTNDSERKHTRTAMLEKKVPASEYLENVARYLEILAQIDKQMLDELEIMFIGLYTANYNGL